MNAAHEFVTVVSGSPRNGTSLLLRMLAAGGLEVLADPQPKPGQPLPHGYYDYAPSLALDVDVSTSDWVTGALGKAVKVMAYQLQYLSPACEYRVAFVCRSVEEALGAWESMGLGAATTEADLLQRPGMRTLLVVHGKLTADPAAQAARVAEFLWLPLDVGAMAGAAPRVELR